MDIVMSFELDNYKTLYIKCGKVVDGGSIRLQVVELLNTLLKDRPTQTRIC